ncbi:MAG: hypothetical protein M1838_002251 [Thelocarpon superellum]|nr:MAG: hypothetical protein M1838_002251 [Thelocarpon superellum]
MMRVALQRRGGVIVTSTSTALRVNGGAANAFSTSSIARKSATEAVKDTVKTVDRTVSDVAVKGIEQGQEATAKAREVMGIKSEQANAKAQELKGEAAGKASELHGEAQGKASELQGKAKGTAEEVKRNL